MNGVLFGTQSVVWLIARLRLRRPSSAHVGVSLWEQQAQLRQSRLRSVWPWVQVVYCVPWFDETSVPCVLVLLRALGLVWLAWLRQWSQPWLKRVLVRRAG